MGPKKNVMGREQREKEEKGEKGGESGNRVSLLWEEGRRGKKMARCKI